jgi:hypothetical protein
MSIFEGKPAPFVTTTRTTGTTAPQYLTDYLSQLAKTGQGLLGNTQVAAPGALQQQAYAMAPTALTGYQQALRSGVSAAQGSAAPIGQQDISQFYNPFQQSVVDEMARQSQRNVERNLLPQLKGAFVGSGGLGSQRYAGATGQVLADVSADLLGQQAKTMSAGYGAALDAALRQKAQQAQAAQVLGGLGQAEQAAATSGLKMLSDLGAQQQAYEQARIEAPMVRAQNVAQLLRGYTYPTTATETYTGPASSYTPSALSQIAGLGSLLASGFNQKGSGWAQMLGSGLGKFFSGFGESSSNSPLIEHNLGATTEWGSGQGEVGG